MRIGTLLRGSRIQEIVECAESARAIGYSSVWITDGIGMDPLTTLAVVGRAVPGIELASGVVRTLARHPMALAQQALTVNAMTGGRLLLGIGPSHRRSMEQGWGLSFARPVATMQDYLSVLRPLLRDRQVAYTGDIYSAQGEFQIDSPCPVPVLVGALGPRMLEVAGRMADGTVTFMTGSRTLIEFTCPTIRSAAAQVGRPSPRVVAVVAVSVSEDKEAAAQRALEVAGPMVNLPFYAAALEREGGPALLSGTEAEIRTELGRLEEAGVTDFVPTRIARRGSVEAERTEAFLEELVVSIRA
jgi:5,10-methylenetetrahydromethanopterin reductase